jgi:hypothetical protein
MAKILVYHIDQEYSTKKPLSAHEIETFFCIKPSNDNY